jgi:putative transposase
MLKKTRGRGLAGLRGRDLVIAVRNDLLAEGKDVSLVRLCRWVGVPRSTVYYQPRQRQARPIDGILANLVYAIIQAFPTFGIRRVWAYLKYRLKWAVNRKKVARIMQHFGWCMHKRVRAVGHV